MNFCCNINGNVRRTLVFRLVQESVRWLAGKGEKEKCIKILKDIARKNGKIVKPEVYESFRVSVVVHSST